MFLWWGVVSTSPNSKAVRPSLVGCPRLLIQYIGSYPPYWRPFLHPQPEDAACHVDRDPLITECLILPRAERNSMNFPWWHHLPAWQFLSPSSPHNSTPAEYHAMRDAQTTCIQFRLFTMWFSHLSTSKIKHSNSRWSSMCRRQWNGGLGNSLKNCLLAICAHGYFLPTDEIPSPWPSSKRFHLCLIITDLC